MVTNARELSRAGGRRATNLSARQKTHRPCGKEREAKQERERDQTTMSGLEARAETRRFSKSCKDAGEFSLFMDLENKGTTFQHQLKNGHRESRKFVVSAYSDVLPVDDRCSLDLWFVLPMSSGLADKHVCRFPHCQWAVGRILETDTGAPDGELLASNLDLENQTRVITAFQHMISWTLSAFAKDSSQKFLTVFFF